MEWCMAWFFLFFFFFSTFFAFFFLQPGYGPCVLGSGSQTAKRGELLLFFFFSFTLGSASGSGLRLTYDMRERKEETDKLETKRESGRLFD